MMHAGGMETSPMVDRGQQPFGMGTVWDIGLVFRCTVGTWFPLGIALEYYL